MDLFTLVQDKDKRVLKYIEQVSSSIDQGWKEFFRPFFESGIMYQVLKQVFDEADKGYKMCPGSKNLFAAFEKCKYEDLKVIIMAQDPYPQPGIADGLAFSCSITKVPQPSLLAVHKQIQNTVYKDNKKQVSSDLTYLASQGVLLINCALTTRENMIGQHYHIWEPFIKYMLRQIVTKNPDVPIVLIGGKAQEYISYCGRNKVLTAEHPAFAARQRRDWICNDAFNRINEILISQKKQPIEWLK